MYAPTVCMHNRLDDDDDDYLLSKEPKTVRIINATKFTYINVSLRDCEKELKELAKATTMIINA